MATTVTIEAGDTLASVAAEHGFVDPSVIWDAPENADLKARRKPDILSPGDRLFIPDRVLRRVQLATGQKHQVKVTRAQVKLRLQLRDILGQPRAGATCKLSVDGADQDLTADGDGVVELPIEPGTRDAVLTLDGQEYDLEVGQLDPIATDAGVRARLRNLGYLVDGMGTDDEALRFAIELFQVDHELAVAGDDIDSIRAKLEEVHGC